MQSFIRAVKVAKSQQETDEALSMLFAHLIQREDLGSVDFLEPELLDILLSTLKRILVLGVAAPVTEYICRKYRQHMSEHPNCLGLTEAFMYLTKTEPLRTIFAKVVGISGLAAPFSIMARSLFRPNTHESSAFDQGVFESLPDSARDWFPHDPDSRDFENRATPEFSQFGSPTPTRNRRPSIPKLSLPLRGDATPPNNRRNRRLSSNSVPISPMFELRGSFGSRRGSFKGEIDFEYNPKNQLQTLAGQIGETFMASDLAYLLAYLPSSAPQIQAPPSETPRNTFKRKSNNLEEKTFLNLLKIMTNITSTVQLIQENPSPVQLIYNTLSQILIDKQHSQYASLYRPMFRVLSNYANYVEYVYKKSWTKVTTNLSLEQKTALRKKIDEVVWSVYKKCTGLIDQPTVESEIISQCILLAEYMRNCQTRVMGAQVCEVCLPLLIKAKIRLFRSEIKIGNLAAAKGVNIVLDLFSELFVQNPTPLLDKLFFRLLLDDEDTWLFLCNYSNQIVGNSDVERICFSSGQGKRMLTEFRTVLIRFYHHLLQLLQRYASATSLTPDEWEANLKKFDFLVNPATGVCNKFLHSEASFNSPVTREISQLHCCIFSQKSSFRKKKDYVDTYISYHYLNFIKYYNNEKFDRKMFENCKMHLDVLIAFALHSSKLTQTKFYLLRVVNFLVHEMSLEHEQQVFQSKVNLSNSNNLSTLCNNNNNTESHKPEALHLGNVVAAKKPAKTIPKLALGSALKKGAEPSVPISRERSFSNPVNPSFLSSPPKISKRPQIPKLNIPTLKRSSDSSAPKARPATGQNDPNQFYEQSKKKHMLYFDTDLHVAMVLLLLCLMLSPSTECLDSLYSDQFPLMDKKPNIPYILYQHLNYPGNVHITPTLVHQVIATKNRGVFILLKLLSQRMFYPCLGENASRIGHGAYGSVWASSLTVENVTLVSNVAVKLTPIPRSISDRCAFYDVFPEVLIMDKFQDHRIAHLFDFGVDNDNYWLVMKKYPCSLRAWRLRQTKSLEQNKMLYINVYLNILRTCEFLTEKRINHYDLKCDNFLVQYNHENLDELYNQPTDIPNFSLILADFGTAKVYKTEKDAFTTRSRGTDCIKSPEMLVASSTKKDFDRRKRTGANSASDVWSLGCLFYELLTGEWLFNFGEGGEAQLFTILTEKTDSIMPAAARENLGNDSILIEYLEYVLVKKAHFRPTLGDIFQKCLALRLKYEKMRTITTAFSSKFFHRAESNSLPPPDNESNSNLPKLKDDRTLTPEEVSFFEKTALQITPHLFVAKGLLPFNCEDLVNKYKITHLLSCGSPTNPWPMQFEFFSADFSQKSQLQDLLWQTCLFIQNVSKFNGKVLVFKDLDSKDTSCYAIAIAYLIWAHRLSIHEAWVRVKKIDYSAHVSKELLLALCDFKRSL